MSGYIIRVDTYSGRVGIIRPQHYNVISKSVLNFGRKFADGEACTIEVYRDTKSLHLSDPWVLHFDANFKKVNY